jgi:hypothetical protein
LKAIYLNSDAAKEFRLGLTDQSSVIGSPEKKQTKVSSIPTKVQAFIFAYVYFLVYFKQNYILILVSLLRRLN